MTLHHIRKEPYAAFLLLFLGLTLFFYKFLPYLTPLTEVPQLPVMIWLIGSQLLFSSGSLTGAFYVYSNHEQIQKEADDLSAPDKTYLLMGVTFVLLFLLYLASIYGQFSLVLPITGAISFFIALLLNK
jgi:hypothetical protein